ncbi:MAG: DUF3516 domain-containing protein [Acidobacteria bacterium]|nr:MAG: DUF3516 domain-containing protein [Acidobacteriota bacterium]
MSAPLQPTEETSAASRPSLIARRPPGGIDDPEEILDRFLDWVGELGFELFPAQEEALLEIMAGRHVVLNTPTGSGKSLVAAGMHFKALCQNRVTFYTAPIKALASEKFFELCDLFGADNVGMLTGDASINSDAPLICCTAEVLANLALREGDELQADAVVMDEFHYYSDRDRGVAWQIPLIACPQTTFLLMSATLGNPAPIVERLEKRSGRKAATVTSAERPVPLDFEWRETPLHETVQSLADQGKAPIYVVSFTQRECAELAQSFTSLKLTEKDDKAEIRDAIGGFRFDTAYGKDMRRFLGFGIGVHHAGLLPKYRLLVERLSQQGLLRVICGTDTLGVGVNVPIRTVLFTKLCKYDGTKVGILSVRDFKQIAGRAGRKGFDVAGSVVCQAPEHEIENLRADQKAAAQGRKKKPPRKSPPKFGYVHYDRNTFEQLIERPAETLESSFRIDHGTVLNLIQRDLQRGDPNFTALRELIAHCHEPPERRAALLREAGQLVLSLYRADIVALSRDPARAGYRIGIDEELQLKFSLHQTLSLYLVETLGRLDPESEEYALDVLSFAEAILEDPTLILRRQVDKLKDELIARLKAEGVEYEERMEELEKVTWPKPNAELIYATFDAFRARQPWVQGENIRPKGIGREIWENYLSFGDVVQRYGIQRTEGLLLRYLSQLYRVLVQTVPDEAKDEQLWEMVGFFRTLLSRVDSSLLTEWEALLDPHAGSTRVATTEGGERRLESLELLTSPRAFDARLRAELHQLVRALARQDWEEAADCVWQPGEHPGAEPAPQPTLDTPEAIEAAMAPYFEEYGSLPFTPASRAKDLTRIERLEPGHWRIEQTLLDPEEDGVWGLIGEVRLDPAATTATAHELGLDRPIFRLLEITS